MKQIKSHGFQNINLRLFFTNLYGYMYNHNCSFIQTLLMRRNIFTFSSVVFGQLYEIMPQKVKMYDAQNLTINFCLFFFTLGKHTFY